MPGKRAVHCYAAGDDAGWEAICLDLDIAVQGRTFEDVLESLNRAISLYLDSLADLPASDRARLLRRPAPLSVRL